jgi:hypothetical protein
LVGLGYVASRAVDRIAALILNWSPIATGAAGQIVDFAGAGLVAAWHVGDVEVSKCESTDVLRPESGDCPETGLESGKH